MSKANKQTVQCLYNLDALSELDTVSHHPLTIKQSILHKQLLLLFESQDKVSDSPKFSCLSADYCHLTILLSPDRVTSLSGRGAGECDVRLVRQVQDKVPRQVRSLARVSRALINPPLLSSQPS